MAGSIQRTHSFSVEPGCGGLCEAPSFSLPGVLEMSLPLGVIISSSLGRAREHVGRTNQGQLAVLVPQDRPPSAALPQRPQALHCHGSECPQGAEGGRTQPALPASFKMFANVRGKTQTT